jgi:hypothetical protein
MSWLKTFCLFPDTQKIYGGDNHMEMHAAAISTDEGMLRTPIGSAFCTLMRRLASAAGLTPPDFAEAKRLLHQSKSWYQRLKKTPYILSPVEESAFLFALQDLCFSRGFDDPVPEWKDLEAELLTVSSLPADIHSGGVRCLYHPRFGRPKVEHRKLDLFAALHKLAGKRDLPSYNQVVSLVGFMTKTKAQKQRAKQGKNKPNAPARNPQPPKVGKKKRTRRNRARKAMSGGDGGLRFPRGGGPNQPNGKPIFRDELVAVIAGSVNFVTTKFALNPGLPQTFPGLSNDAKNYGEWRLIESCFYTRPLVSGFSTQGQTGETILSFDSNVQNPAPNSQQQAEFMPHVQDSPYEKIVLHLDPMEVNRSDAKYVRTAGVPAGGDPKTYDGGNIYISTYGQGGTANVCELRHRSTFHMFKPTLLNPPTTGGEMISGGGSLTAATPFGAAPISSGAFQLSGAATNVVSLSGLLIGDEIVVSAYSSGTVLSGYTIGTLVGLAAISSPGGIINAAGTLAAQIATFKVTAINASFVLTVTATTVTGSTLIVADMGPVQDDIV